MFLSSQNEELMNILEELQTRIEVLEDSITQFTSNDHLKRHFYPATIFNLSHMVQKLRQRFLKKVDFEENK